jgi:hypothetical protein
MQGWKVHKIDSTSCTMVNFGGDDVDSSSSVISLLIRLPFME